VAGGRIEFYTAFISDTIAFGASFYEVKDRSLAEWHCVNILGGFISTFIDEAAHPPVPLAYRGAIAVGQFALDSHFCIGPAVDEAAGAMDLADAALVWLTPAPKAL